MSENGETPLSKCTTMDLSRSNSGCIVSSFRLVGLPFEPFAKFFAMSDSALAGVNIRRVVAQEKPGFPCRVSLVDAEIGEELLLLPYEHQPAGSPYRASGPIFVRQAAKQALIEAGIIPDYVRDRLISVRAYDAAHLMTDAALCEGRDAAPVIRAMFASEEVAYIHLHNAKRGCFSCAVQRE